jgi:hypothetical protein
LLLGGRSWYPSKFVTTQRPSPFAKGERERECVFWAPLNGEENIYFADA